MSNVTTCVATGKVRVVHIYFLLLVRSAFPNDSWKRVCNSKIPEWKHRQFRDSGLAKTPGIPESRDRNHYISHRVGKEDLRWLLERQQSTNRGLD